MDRPSLGGNMPERKSILPKPLTPVGHGIGSSALGAKIPAHMTPEDKTKFLHKLEEYRKQKMQAKIDMTGKSKIPSIIPMVVKAPINKLPVPSAVKPVEVDSVKEVHKDEMMEVDKDEKKEEKKDVPKIEKRERRSSETKAVKKDEKKEKKEVQKSETKEGKTEERKENVFERLFRNNTRVSLARKVEKSEPKPEPQKPPRMSIKPRKTSSSSSLKQLTSFKEPESNSTKTISPATKTNSPAAKSNSTEKQLPRKKTPEVGRFVRAPRESLPPQKPATVEPVNNPETTQEQNIPVIVVSNPEEIEEELTEKIAPPEEKIPVPEETVPEPEEKIPEAGKIPETAEKVPEAEKMPETAEKIPEIAEKVPQPAEKSAEKEFVIKVTNKIEEKIIEKAKKIPEAEKSAEKEFVKKVTDKIEEKITKKIPKSEEKIPVKPPVVKFLSGEKPKITKKIEKVEKKLNNEIKKPLLTKPIKQAKPLPKNNKIRRSISMIHRKKTGDTESAIHRTVSDLNLSFTEPEIKTKKPSPLKEENEIRGRSKSVSFATPKAKTPTPHNLRDKLENWLKDRGHSISGYRHLNCFGVQNSVFQTPKGFNESLEKSQYATAPNTPVEDFDKENMTPTPATAIQRIDIAEVEGWLQDLHKLIVELKYPHARCEEWLSAIRRKCNGCTQLHIYWECLAALEESRGDMNTAIEYYERAIIKGAEVKTVGDSLEHLFDKLIIDSDKTPSKPDKAMDPKNIFKSTIIKFALQQKAVKDLGSELGANAKQKLMVATPVRRSTRIQTPYKPHVVNSLTSLDPELKDSYTFQPNKFLLTEK